MVVINLTKSVSGSVIKARVAVNTSSSLRQVVRTVSYVRDATDSRRQTFIVRIVKERYK